MLDPVKNASAIGTLLIGLGIIFIILLILGVSQGAFNISGGTLGFLFALIPVLGYFAVGFGLRKSKRWAIWGLGILALLILLPVIQGNHSWAQIAILIFIGGLFIWFLSAKDKFS